MNYLRSFNIKDVRITEEDFLAGRLPDLISNSKEIPECIPEEPSLGVLRWAKEKYGLSMIDRRAGDYFTALNLFYHLRLPPAVLQGDPGIFAYIILREATTSPKVEDSWLYRRWYDLKLKKLAMYHIFSSDISLNGLGRLWFGALFSLINGKIHPYLFESAQITQEVLKMSASRNRAVTVHLAKRLAGYKHEGETDDFVQGVARQMTFIFGSHNPDALAEPRVNYDYFLDWMEKQSSEFKDISVGRVMWPKDYEIDMDSVNESLNFITDQIDVELVHYHCKNRHRYYGLNTAIKTIIEIEDVESAIARCCEEIRKRLDKTVPEDKLALEQLGRQFRGKWTAERKQQLADRFMEFLNNPVPTKIDSVLVLFKKVIGETLEKGHDLLTQAKPEAAMRVYNLFNIQKDAKKPRALPPEETDDRDGGISDDGRTPGELSQEEMKQIWESRGAMTLREIEAKFKLKMANGNTAWRVCHRYEELVKV